MFRVKYRYGFILLLALYSYLNIYYTVGEKLFDFTIPKFLLASTLTVVVFGIWELNRLVEARTENIRRFLRIRLHPLIVIFLLSMVNVSVVCFLTMELLYKVLEMPLQINSAHLRLLLAFGFRINLFLNCINAIVFYMDQLKRTQLEAEQFKKNLIEAQFEALRNQINPHFLFNCFNVLSTLVYKDADTSSKFIMQLSSVYRYLLYNQEKRIVLLKDELQFIEAYLYLIRIRFGESILIENTITREAENMYVAPAVIQMLIENSIKHNVSSKKHPLKISISTAGRYLIVSNNLQEKIVKEESLKIGLRNIQSRYEFLSDKKVEICRSETQFVVKVPLLEIESL